MKALLSDASCNDKYNLFIVHHIAGALCFFNFTHNVA